MTVANTADPVLSGPGRNPAACWKTRTARATARWGRSGAVISVHGEIDAANADQLGEYVRQCAARCEWLVLDLSDLEFMGAAGFSALQTIEARCISGKVQWVLVPGTAVSRLLRVCDPDSSVATSESMAAALAYVQKSGLLHLVS